MKKEIQTNEFKNLIEQNNMNDQIKMLIQMKLLEQLQSNINQNITQSIGQINGQSINKS
jgi:hypothetical protein